MTDAVALRTLALCSGLGVTERAVHRVVPARLVVAVERQAYCAATLVARMEEEAVPRAPIWDDLTTFDGRPWHGRVDLCVAGFPCQAASVAGKRAGIADDRWLWPHVARIIDECGAPMLLIENVPGLLSVNGGVAFEEVVGFMAARGWVASWDCVPAGTVGAPHVRDRLFVLGADPDRIDVRQLAERHQRQGWRVRAPERGDREPVHDGADGRPGRAGSADAADLRRVQWQRWIGTAGRPAPRPSFSGVADGHAGGMERDPDAYDPDRDWADRVHAIGNSVVEEAAATAFAMLLERLVDLCDVDDPDTAASDVPETRVLDRQLSFGAFASFGEEP
jgi:DNA (cytosine-5)-methyltransferase 1